MPRLAPRASLRLFASSLALLPALTTAGQDPQLAPVVVTAERLQREAGLERAATPGAVTVLDAETLQQRSVTHVADMLRYVPGVWAESYNGNDEVFYSSRGSNLDATDYDRNGVKLLQDGLPLSAADGNNHNRSFDPLNARAITVAHGANALAYGASTLGGAIDVTTPTAHNAAPLSVALSGGSFGQWSARASLAGVSGAFDGLLSAESLQRDGYRAHSRQRRNSLNANVGWQPGETVSTRLFVSGFDYDIQLPRELTAADYAANPRQARADALEGDHGKQVRAWRTALKTTVIDVAGGDLEVGISHERQSLYHPIVSSPFFSLLIDTRHEDSGAMLRWRGMRDDHALLFGANYGFSKVRGGNYENVAGQRGAFMWPSAENAWSLELFALDRWALGHWTLVYGTQFVTADREAAGMPARYEALNPRIGLIREFAGAEWYASLSRTWEAPTTYELVDEASGGTRPLRAMHGVVLESGLRGSAMHARTRFSWDVSAYYTRLHDEILSVDDPAAPGTSLSANIARTTHAGIEALLGASIDFGGAHRIEPLLSATFNAFAFDADPVYGDNRLPAAPRWFARGEIMYAHVSGLRAGPTFDFVGPRFADFANSYRVGSHGLIGARASFERGSWQVYVEGRNLLDRPYVATLAVKDRADAGTELLYPGAPRSVYFGLRYRN